MLLGLAAVSAQGAPAQKTFQLYATDGEHRTADGKSIYIWGYSLTPERGSAGLPGPTIEVNEGDFVRLTLTNLGPSRAGVHEFPHTVHLHGLDVSQANDGVPETSHSVRVGESFTYEFVATHAGTYWYHCHVDTVEHLTMGMYGPLIVHPADGPGRAWTDGPEYERAYTLLLSESDPLWAETIGENETPDRTTYHPRYFFINGRSFPETMDHADTHLLGHLGDRILVRLINAGYQWRSMHMHGFHFEVIASDGRPLQQPYQKDTITIGPGERYDLLVTLDQLGSYPFHSHVILDNLNDGAYPGGIHTMLSVLAPGEPLEPAGHADGQEPGSATPSHVHVETAPTSHVHGSSTAAAEDSASLQAAGEYVVEMRGDRFYPEVLVVPPGATVTWVNLDPRTHSLASELFGHDVSRGTSFSFTFTEPGYYRYECTNHRSMTGVVRVR